MYLHLKHENGNNFFENHLHYLKSSAAVNNYESNFSCYKCSSLVEAYKNDLLIDQQQLAPNNWKMVKHFHRGMYVRGNVINATHNGAIIEIQPGVKGFIPEDEVSWGYWKPCVPTLIQNEQGIEAIVVSVSNNSRYLFLSMKELEIDMHAFTDCQCPACIRS